MQKCGQDGNDASKNKSLSYLMDQNDRLINDKALEELSYSILKRFLSFTDNIEKILLFAMYCFGKGSYGMEREIYYLMI